MKIPQALVHVVTSDPEVLGGTVCFLGTRVPLATFIDYIEAGYSLDRFLQGFSGVSREQAVAVLGWQAHQSRLAAGLEAA